jgi:hypothetical protein
MGRSCDSFVSVTGTGNDKSGGERVLVPQPSPDQAGSGWGTRGVCGGLEENRQQQRQQPIPVG